MSVSFEDVDWMRLALAEARKGLGAVEPNPMVGAVVVREGRMVGFGHHEQFGGPHAEVIALRQAGESAGGATLYVTLEPCCHFGKTPPCTDAILAAGIARVVVAVGDPFPAVNGGGLAILERAGVAIEVGCEAEAARSLNAPYWKRLTTGLPYVLAKWAMTLDGKTAVASGDSRWISSKSSRRLVHEIRGRMDAIVVGIGTVEADDPLLTARPPGPRTPARVVIDSTARLSAGSRLARTAGEFPVIVAVTDRAPTGRRQELERMGCDILAFGGSGTVPIARLMEELGRRGMTNVLVEGGGRILGSFLDEGLVDAVEVFIATIIEGGDHPRTAARGAGRNLMNEAIRLLDPEVDRIGGDIHIRGRLPRPWRIAAGFPEE
ncbi:MAG: bifunctional diaminohydroxyphosphoribosylaminopyrimidine deaminase/5-amino-6-(5-phosphoribosylamino)uracil reductase RibD [Isosphaeraceae bacterium]